jgi:hypothetical protein
MALSSSRALKLVEACPTIKYTSWTQVGGSDAYKATIDTANLHINNTPLDIVGVRSLVKTDANKRGRLTRVESSALCQSTDGSFWYDVDNSELNIHMPDDSGPDGTSVVAEFLMPFAAEGGSYPILYGDKVINGTFEAGSGWSTALSSADVTMTQSSTDYAVKGSASGKIYHNGNDTNPYGYFYQDVACTSGVMYRLSGAYYRLSTSEDTWEATIVLRDQTDTLDANDDGRSYSAVTVHHQLGAVNGIWKRFVFDFIAANTGNYVIFIGGSNANAGGSPSGTVYFDDVKLQVISRYQYYEPRLMSGLPTINEGTHDRAFGGKQIGNASVSFAHGEGGLYKFWNSVEWPGAEVRMFRGADSILGTLPRDAFKQVFRGTVSSAEADDRQFAIQAQDFRSFLQTNIALSKYNLNDFSAMESSRVGDVRPWLFGDKTNIRPVLVADSASQADYGSYELVDVTDPINSSTVINAPSKVWAYIDEQSADLGLTTARLEISGSPVAYYAWTNTGSRIDLAIDAQVLRVASSNAADGDNLGEAANNKLDFEVGTQDAVRVWVRDEGTSWTDETTDFNDAGAADVTVLPGTPVVGDYFAVCFDVPWDYLVLTVSTARVGGELIWQFLNGSTWTAFENLRDNTQGMATTGKVQWDRPDSWASGTLNSQAGYWVRAIVNTVPSTNPVLTQGRIGVIYTATITDGLYFPYQLAAEVQTQMRSEVTGAPASDIDCAYSDSTHKFTVNRDNGDSLSILSKTGPNSERGIYRMMGGNNNSDATGTYTYTSPEAIFEDRDKDHHIRVDFGGYRDDASGTYTGSANADIVLAPDIFRAVYSGKLGRPLDDIDTASFDAARSGAYTLAAHIDQEMIFEEMIERLEMSEWAEIQVGEDGTIYFKRLDAAASVVENLTDVDLLSYRCYTDDSDIYEAIGILYEDDPRRRRLRRRGIGRHLRATEEGPIKAYVTSSDDVGIQFQKKGRRDFPTYLTSNTDAITIAGKIDDIAFTSGTFHEISTRKLIDAHAGDDVTLTRASGGGSGGALSSVACRIQTLSKDYDPGIVRALLLET